jgi:hypothetical protein
VITITGTSDHDRVEPPITIPGMRRMGEDEHTIPWSKLTYDTGLGGYRTDITEEQLRGAPSFYRDRDDYDWSDRERERELHDYWRTPYYWGI